MNATVDLCKSQEAVTLGLMEAAGIGARIRQLREGAGLQSQELAASLGLDPSAMSNIENGKRSVKSGELATIASVLGVSPLAILSDDSFLGDLPVAARSPHEPASASAALARLRALAELHQVLSDHGVGGPRSALEELPTVDLDDWLQSADKVSGWARDHYFPMMGLLPKDRFADLAEAIERNFGVDVMVEDYSPGEILGACITDHRFPLILVNRDQSISRALFTLAHELGHVLSGEGEQAMTLDINLTEHTAPEMFANAFAASFLMPTSNVQAIIDQERITSKGLARMVTEFGVSFESLVYRLHNLGYISAAQRDQLRSRGWPAVLADLDPEERRRALGRQGMSPERRPPGLLVMRTLQGYQQGVVSVRPLAGLLGLDPDELLIKFVREKDSQDAVETYYPAESETSDEERYSGSPV